MKSPQLLPQGAVIRDTYTVDEHIGSGAFAEVYRVRHRYMGMQAMKVLRDGRTEAQRVAGLFEAFRLSRISHPAIVRVFDGNCLEAALGGDPYVTMELVDGGTLEDLSDSSGPRFVSNLLDACDQLASALAHAHGQSPAIVHRDVKPTNVLVHWSEDGAISVRLADFGLAVPVDETLGFADGHGTIAYRSPESLFGFEIPASDVYSWGLTIYEAATGVFPFKAKLRDAATESTSQLVEALREIQKQPIDPPSFFRHAIHPAIDVVVMRTLVVDHERRIRDGKVLETATRAMRVAAEGDPTPSSTLVKALRVCQDPASGAKGLELLGKALRAEPSRGTAYLPMLGFLRSERDRLNL